MATRRAVLGRIALGLGLVACRGAIGQPAARAAYVGIETSARTGASRARFLTASGETSARVPLDFRAHGMARHGRRLIVFPRRPGDRFAAVDLETLETRVAAAPADRHFYGHGAFTVDGTTLLVTENDLATLAGGVGIYDAARLRRLGGIALPGPGPHEIVRAPGRDLFHVALGGLQTHPAYGRTPLNLAGFRSQVVTLDLDRGDPSPLGHWAGTEGVSLRHLAIDGAGRLFVGGQLVDPARGRGDRVLWRCDAAGAQSLPAGAELAGYVSSVASHGAETLVTSKEAGVALRLVNGETVETVRLDGASAAACGPGLTALSGYAALRLNDVRIDVSDGHEFDNHGLAAL